MIDEQTSGEDMKTITFEGKEYEVPVWVKWVAKDGSGSVYAFNLKPIPCHYDSLWLEDPRFGKRCILIDQKDSWDKAIIAV